MMITLFTIVHYRYHPTPDRKKREIMAEWRVREEGDSLFPPSLDSYFEGSSFVRPAANDRRRQLSIDGCFRRGD